MVGRATLGGLLAALLWLALLPARSSLAAPPLVYTLDASLVYETGLVKVRETLAFTNPSTQTLDSLVFNVTPAYYGAFQLLQATANGEEVEARLEGSILELPLPQPLPPGRAMVATLDFQLQVPRRGGRFGRGPQAMALGNWFPLLAVYRDGRLLAENQPAGWVRGQYVQTGDAFFSQTADFRVALRSDQPLTVAHSGSLVSQEENTWEFEARGVRDFALALSPGFAMASQDVEGVEVTVFYLSGHESAAAIYLQAAAEMLAWMKEKLVPYPYRSLQMAEIDAQGSTMVGQEYPHLIFMANSIAFSAAGVDSYGSILAVHEVAHQWYYGLVGNDQLYEPWLDEALATWLSYHLLRARNVPSFPWLWQGRVLSPPLPELAVNVGIYDYPSEGPYLALAYRRGALFLEELYQLMGEASFLAGLREYTSTFSGRIATPYAFLDTMQAHTEANLNPLISRYFNYPRYLAPEPLRVTATFPRQEWPGTVRIALESEAALQAVQVFVDDRLHLKAPPSQVLVQTNMLEEGPHLLTLRVSDGQREVDLVATLVVKHPPPPEPATPTPAAISPEAVEETSSAFTQGEADTAPSTGERRAAGLALLALSAAALAAGLARGNHDHVGR